MEYGGPLMPSHFLANVPGMDRSGIEVCSTRNTPAERCRTGAGSAHTRLQKAGGAVTFLGDGVGQCGSGNVFGAQAAGPVSGDGRYAQPGGGEGPALSGFPFEECAGRGEVGGLSHPDGGPAPALPRNTDTSGIPSMSTLA